MPDGGVLASLPIDSNGDGIYSAEEYLTAPPFLGSLYQNGMSGFLQYLRYAMDKATLGAGLADMPAVRMRWST